MASTKQNDSQKPAVPEGLKSQGLSLSNSKIESYSGISEENDRNSNLSPSKSADPARKKTFKIISVKKGGSGSGDIVADNDADSIDGLDESQTEDLSSEFCDSSKATDLDMDLQDSMNMPLTPDEVTSTTTIVVKQKPDRDSQSRFKVVKIETKEPFRRGKWVCYDFFDTAPASVVTLEKNGSKVTEDSIIHSALSGNLSSSSSVHYVQDVNDSSSNIFVTPVVPLSPTTADGQPILSDVFVPIQPAPASQVFSQLDSLSSDVMSPFLAQQVLMSVAGVAHPSASASFQNIAQPGHTTIVQSLPHTNVFPYAQNGPPTGLFQNGVTVGQTAQDGTLVVGATPSSVLATTPTSGEDNTTHTQQFVIIGGVPVPRSQSQTQIAGAAVNAQGAGAGLEGSQSATTGTSIPATTNSAGVPQSRGDASVISGGEGGDQMGPGMDDSTGSIKTLQGDVEGQTPQGLEEAVETMYIDLEGHEEDVDERPGHLVSQVPALPLERPSALPSHLDPHSRHLDSPCSFCLTPIHSLCASPIPPSMMEPYDPMPIVSMAASMFQPPVSSPSLPSFVAPSSMGYNMDSVYAPTAFQPPVSSPSLPSFVAPSSMGYNMDSVYAPTAISGFPQSEPFVATSYFPYQPPPSGVLFSPASAFVPLSMPVVSMAPGSMALTQPCSMGPSMSSNPTMSQPSMSMSMTGPSVSSSIGAIYCQPGPTDLLSPMSETSSSMASRPMSPAFPVSSSSFMSTSTGPVSFSSENFPIDKSLDRVVASMGENLLVTADTEQNENNMEEIFGAAAPLSGSSDVADDTSSDRYSIALTPAREIFACLDT